MSDQTNRTPKPVIQKESLYLASDRIVCGDIYCAGRTAYYTGYDLGRNRLMRMTTTQGNLTALGRMYDQVLKNLMPIQCECGKVSYKPSRRRKRTS